MIDLTTGPYRRQLFHVDNNGQSREALESETRGPDHPGSICFFTTIKQL